MKQLIQMLMTSLGIFFVTQTILVTPLISQSSFINETSITYSELNSEQQRLYDVFVVNQNRSEVAYIVTVNEIDSIHIDGNILLSFPGLSKAAWITPQKVELTNDGYVWIGEVSFIPDSMSYESFYDDGVFSVIKQTNYYEGTFVLNQEIYVLKFLGDNIYVVIKEDLPTLSTTCGNENSDATLEYDYWDVPYGDLSSRNNKYCPATVLALYTSKASEVSGGDARAEAIIRLAIENTNYVMFKSEIAPTEIQLDLLDIRPYNFVETAIEPSMEDDHEDRFLPLLDNPLSDLSLMRDEYDADIVILFTDGNYLDAVGRAGTLNLQAEKAGIIIEIDYANTGYNTAHEVAHLYRCKHQSTVNNPPNQGFEFAKEFKTGHIFKYDTRQTAVYTGPKADYRIPYYSNPRVYYRGDKTGTENTKDNARMMNAVGCDVASFSMINIDPLIVSTDAPYKACHCEFLTIRASVTGGGTGNYIFDWQLSEDGLNYTSTGYTEDYLVFAMPCDIRDPNNPGLPTMVFIRLLVTSPNGSVDIRTMPIRVTHDVDQDGEPCDLVVPRISKSDVISAYKLYPNPGNDEIFLMIEGKIFGRPTMDIYNEFGQNVTFSLDFKEFIDENSVKLSTSHLPFGMYFVVIREDNKEPVTLKFIKEK